jgi:hypothetical protein
MIDQVPELDATDFLHAARLERDGRRQRRELDRAEALAVLHHCRDTFRDQADNPAAAERDADRLEHLAERLVDWSGDLKRHLERLEVSRDQVVHRGPVLTLQQSPVEPAALAQGLTESLSEGVLGAHAGAVLRAAVKLAAL